VPTIYGKRYVVALIYIHQEHSKQLLLNEYNTPTGQKNICEDASVFYLEKNKHAEINSDSTESTSGLCKF
jgi:hypothetical protein